MYAIAALVYVLIAGQMVGDPLLVRHKDTFLTEAKCQEFLLSKEFGEQKAVLTERLTTRLTEMHQQAAAAGDAEGVPLPVVAITASCEADPRV